MAHDTPPVSNRRNAYRRHEDRQLLQRERELDAAQRICKALFQHIRVDELVVKVLQTALDVIGAQAGSVLLADFEKKQLVFRYVIGEKADLLQGTAIGWDEGIAGVVFSRGEAEVTSDVKGDRRHYPAIDQLTGFETRDMITLPLKRWGGEPIGVLQVLNKRDGRLDDDDLAILTIISALSATEIEQARLFEQARLAEVVRLLGDIGHDVKNMLQPVLAGAELLKGEIEDVFANPPKLDVKKAAASYAACREVIDMLLEGAGRIDQRVRQMADCIKNVSAPPHFAACQVSLVVESVLKTLSFSAKEKDIAIRIDGLAELPAILADERRLYNAFYNLINNAIPELNRGGSITIRGTPNESGHGIVISVSDTGRGMPKHILESLFTASAISRKLGGTGLGTKIIKDVVDAHGGEITCESEEAVGTTFTLHLPLQPPDAKATKISPAFRR